MTPSELACRVREHIGQEHRYEHSIRVAQAAETLARLHGVDAEKAYLAGMLHDLARLYSAERLIAESEVRGFSMSDAERDHPTLLHARLGAALAREAFGIEDAEVLSAIEKHTTGDAVMSPLDCVVYLADSLEPNRRFAEREQLWEFALRDLEGATRATMRHAAEHHARKRQAAEASESAS